MNEKIILYLLSRICASITIALLLPMYVAFHYDESVIDFLCAALASALFALIFHKYGKGAKLKEATMREWVCTIFFGWFLAAAFCALPYVLAGVLTPVNAFFESMSGLTTTGVTAVANISALPQALLFWRTFTGWLGGIASILVFVVVLPQFAGSSAYLFNSLANGNASMRVLPRIKDNVIVLFYIYIVLTLFLTCVLIFGGLNPFDSFNHACSTVSTTGFALHDGNVAHVENFAMLAMSAICMLLSGGNFALYYHATQKGIKVLWQDAEFRTYILGVITISLLITANVVYETDAGFGKNLTAAFFETASFASTTGYVATEYNNWPTFSKLLLGILLFVGGCSGSTAGGLKVGRLLILVKILFLELRRVLHPNMLLSVMYNKRALPISTIMNISRYFFIYMLVIVLISFSLAGAGLPPEDALFGAASCVSNIGPAFGLLGNVNSYVNLPDITKIILSLGMFLGRLEIFIVLSMLRKEFWRQSKRW